MRLERFQVGDELVKLGRKLNLLVDYCKAITPKSGENTRIRQTHAGAYISADKSPTGSTPQNKTSFVKSVSYDSDTGYHTVTMRAVHQMFCIGGANSVLEIEETEFVFDVSGNTAIGVFLTKWGSGNIYSPAKYYWYGTTGGVGVGTDTNSREFDSGSLDSNLFFTASILLRNDGTYLVSYDSIPEVYIPLNGKQPFLSWGGGTGENTTPTNGSVSIANMTQPASRRRSGIATLGYGYWTPSGSYTCTVPPSSDDIVCLGVPSFEYQGSSGNPVIQLGASGLATYEVIGHVKTDANGNLERLTDYTQNAKWIPLGLSQTISVRKGDDSGALSLQFLDGILVKVT